MDVIFKWSLCSAQLTPQSVLISWKPVNERMRMATFKSCLAQVIVILCYSPTEAATDADKDSFFNQLQYLLDRVATRDVALVMDG